MKAAFHNEATSTTVTELMKQLYYSTAQELKKCKRYTLKSKIQDKDYFSFSNGKLSRPVNNSLFIVDEQDLLPFWDALTNRQMISIPSDEITRACYTITISFCCNIDLLKIGDQKTPGTYFECFIGHLLARHFDLSPSTQLDVLNLDMKSKLPTDFIFDLGPSKAKFHVPVKTSTRERVVQVWAHQRVLDGVYGTGRFLGLLTCLSETKRSTKTDEVTEICLPDQWLVYQLFIAQLKRIYYLDLPRRYSELNAVSSRIHIKQFGEFFHETDELLL